MALIHHPLFARLINGNRQLVAVDRGAVAELQVKHPLPSENGNTVPVDFAISSPSMVTLGGLLGARAITDRSASGAAVCF